MIAERCACTPAAPLSPLPGLPSRSYHFVKRGFFLVAIGGEPAAGPLRARAPMPLRENRVAPCAPALQARNLPPTLVPGNSRSGTALWERPGRRPISPETAIGRASPMRGFSFEHCRDAQLNANAARQLGGLCSIGIKAPGADSVQYAIFDGHRIEFAHACNADDGCGDDLSYRDSLCNISLRALCFE